MSMEALFRDIDGRMDFTAAHQAEALRWVAELGRAHVSGERMGPARPHELLHQCVRLACAAAGHGRPEVITAMAASPVEAVRAGVAATFQGLKPAHFAAALGRVDVIETLLKIPDKDVQDSLGARDLRGRTPLMLAAAEGRDLCFARLIESGKPEVLAGLTAPDLSGRRPLLVAAENGCYRGIEAVAANPAIRPLLGLRNRSDGTTPAHLAAKGGHARVVEALCRCPDAGVQASLVEPDRFGRTPAQLARQEGHGDVAATLDPENLARSKAVAQPEPVGSTIEGLFRDIDGRKDFTAAHQAEALRWVAELGRAHVSGERMGPARSHELLHQCVRLACAAAGHGRPEVITAMAASPVEAVRAGVAATFQGLKPAHFAAALGRVDVIETLLKIPDKDVQDSLGARDLRGRTPLMLAAAEGRDLCFARLIESGKPEVLAGLTAPDLSGRRPLLVAAENGCYRGIEAVAANPAIRPLLGLRNRSDGTTPAHLAAKGGHARVVEVLCRCPDAGVQASLWEPDRFGRTPADLARQNNHLELARTLDPSERALSWAFADLDIDGRTEAGNLLDELTCPVTFKRYEFTGPGRPVHMQERGTDGGAAKPSKACVSAETAENLEIPGGALHPQNPFTRQPFEGTVDAADRLQLMAQVARAYQEHAKNPPMARVEALKAHAAFLAGPAAPDVDVAPGGAASAPFQVVMERHDAA